MGFSTSDLTILRIRCPACKQYTEKLVTLLARKTNIPCSHCSLTIDLTTPHNAVLISETVESCKRVGAALLAVLDL